MTKRTLFNAYNKPSNLLQAVNYFVANTDSKKVGVFRTSLFKYTLPGLGFECTSSKRMSSQDIQLAEKFLQTIVFEEDIAQILLDAQKSVVKIANLDGKNKRLHRHNLNKFINFLVERKLIKKIDPSVDKPNSNFIGEAYTEKVFDKSKSECNKIKQNPKFNVKLSLNPADYQTEEQSLINAIKETNRIKKELEDLKNFLLKFQRPYTASHAIRHVLRILGWYYNKGYLSLEDLSLYNIVKQININPSIEDFDSMDKVYVAKGIALEQAKREANKLIKFVEEYIEDRNLVDKDRPIQIFSNIAKFLYQDITDSCFYKNYEDIPVIKRLRVYSANLPKKPKKIKNVPLKWKEVMLVLESLRRKADTEILYYQRKETKTQSGSKRYAQKFQRLNTSVASDLQRFLILAFLTLLPPSRSRPIRELRWGETLKHGDFINGHFVSRDDLDLPSQAKYFIHLQPEDYKTGDTYGEVMYEFPNFTFPDGKQFYEYLDRWIYGGERKILLHRKYPDLEHNYIFVKFKVGEPMEQYDFSQAIEGTFKKECNLKIYPHVLRDIYRTHLVNSGATLQELEAAAFLMRHSLETAAKDYTQQTIEEKTRPGVDLIHRINSDILEQLKDKGE